MLAHDILQIFSENRASKDKGKKLDKVQKIHLETDRLYFIARAAADELQFSNTIPYSRNYDFLTSTW